jgi:hypothetical protein
MREAANTASPRPSSRVAVARRSNETRLPAPPPAPHASEVAPEPPKPSEAPLVIEPVPAPAPAQRPWSTLDPRAAAMTIVDPQAQAPTQTPEQKLNAAIVEGAKRPVDKRSEPLLHQGPNGGYVYQGHGFKATIASNGDLEMSDRYGTVAIPFVPFQTADGSWRIAIIGGSFALFEWLDRKFGKNDPYQSERRWFLEHTRALRERMAREHAPRMRFPAR